jgi:hypothetical protein
MSNEDGPELDASDLEDMANEDDLTPEDIFSLTLLDKQRNKRVWVELQDKDGDKVDLTDMIVGLVTTSKIN